LGAVSEPSPSAICRVNFDDPQDVARHDRMMEMVEKMLRLQLVYELYGLTEEIGAIESLKSLRGMKTLKE
jgi:hypothetical protein